MRIELLSTINSDYIVPFRVTVQSLLDHLGNGISLRWHVFHPGIPEEKRRLVESHADDADLEFAWYDVRARQEAWFPVRGHFVPHVYTRLFAPGWLPKDVSRFLYLDGDLLVLDDIAALWSTDLDGAILAAVQDLAVPTVSSPMGLARHAGLGFDTDAPYFNAGLFLADAVAWREFGIARAAADYIEQNQEVINLLDQDALNAVIRGRWKPLDYRWNLVSGPAGRSFCPTRNLDTGQLRRAVENPGIVHFAGLLKPWIQAGLASPWVTDYTRVLRRLYPEYHWDGSVRARSLALYDRNLRHWTHGFEKLVWSTKRGF